MDHYFFEPGNQLTNGFNPGLPIPAQTAKRGGPLPVRFFPYTGTQMQPVPYILPAPYALVLCLKLAAGDDQLAVALLQTFTYDSVNNCYTGTLDLGSVQVTQAFLQATAINAQTGAGYAVALSDKSKLVSLANASSENFTLPDDAVAFQPGDSLWLIATGTGIITVVGGGTTSVTPLNGVSTTLTPGVPVLATKTAAHTWTIDRPVEQDHLALLGEWGWAQTSVSTKLQRTDTFAITLANYIYDGSEGNPTSTADPSAYALKTYADGVVATETARAEGAEGDLTTAIATEALARVASLVTEVNARNSAILVETNRALTAEGLLRPKLAVIGADVTTAAHTLAAADAFTRRRATYAGAFALTVPLNATVPIPVGAWYQLDRAIGGGTTISPTSGVTVLAANGVLAQALNDAGLSIYLVKTLTDTWTLQLTRPPSAYEVERAARQQTLTDVTSSGGTVAIDFANGLNAYLPFSAFAARVLGNPSNLPPAGASGRIIIKQDATGSRTLTYGTGFTIINGTTITLNTGANSFTILEWYYTGATILIRKV